jgi:hypothetical protein
LNSSGGVAFVVKDRGVTGFGYAIFEPGAPEGASHLYDLVIAIGVRMLRQLSGIADWHPLGVQLARALPEDSAPYLDFFRAPVHFDARRPRSSAARRP